MPAAAVLLADGLEEIEAVTIIDVLRRADVEVTTIGLDDREIDGSHGIDLRADTTLSEVGDREFDIVILPGGEPGSTNLENDERVNRMLNEQYDRGGMVAAICAAPRILAQNGFLDEKPATSHPSVREKMSDTKYSTAPVVQAGRVVTSRGPGTAIPFSLQLVQELVGVEKAQELAQHMEFSTVNEWGGSS